MKQRIKAGGITEVVPADKKATKPAASQGVAKPKPKEEVKSAAAVEKTAKAKQPPSPKNTAAKPEEKKKSVSQLPKAINS